VGEKVRLETLLMLSISAARNADYYARLAKAGYYTNAPEEPGKWYGKGAECLGLSGQIQEQDFRRIFEGFHPEDRRRLVQNAGSADRRNAYDLTFTVPKSVSAFWAISDHENRGKIEAIKAEALRRTLDLGSKYVVTRTGRGGEHREPCSLVFALFSHSTSRAEEPNLHTHAVLMNLGVRGDGKTSALDVAEIYRLKMTLGALYRSELARGMKEEFGVRFERVNRSIELLGRDKALCDYWSTRAKEIDHYMKEHGLSGAEAAARACVETRTKKDMETPREEHLKRWVTEAAERGVTAESLLEEMRYAAITTPLHQTPDLRAEIKAAVEERLYAEHSHFTGQKLFQTVAEEAQTSGLSIEEIVSLKEEVEAECKLLYEERNGIRHYTTERTMKLEREYLRNIKELSESTTHHLRASTRKAHLAESLSDEQKLAYLHITGDGQLKFVEGLAGTGKTTFLRHAVRAWKEEGYQTVGAATAAVAAENLSKEAGLDRSGSLAKLFMDYERQGKLDALEEKMKTSWKGHLDELERRGKLSPEKKAELLENQTLKNPLYRAFLDATWKTGSEERTLFNTKPGIDASRIDSKTVMVIDEAAMVGTHDLFQLTEISRTTGAKLVLVGDRGQLQSISPGGAFAGGADRVGKAEVTQIWRQKDEWARNVVYNAAKGSVSDALSKLDEEGKIEFSETQAKAREALIDAWQKEKGESLKETLILTSTVTESENLNRMAQDALLKEGRLNASRPSITSKGSLYFEGDRVMFRKNDRTIGVKNGTFGTIEWISNTGKLTVCLDSGEKRFIDPKSYSEFSLGYASTTHKAQGQTKDKTYILVDDGMIDREMFYVQISRQRRGVKVFVNAEGEGRENAYEAFLKRVSRSNQEVLAHDLERKLREEEKKRVTPHWNHNTGLSQGHSHSR
jgi:conjugative relaxase-like TrwC/TraI family protein